MNTLPDITCTKQIICNNLLKLDTATGKVWQVQYSVTEDLQGEWSVQWKNLNFENMSDEQFDTLDWENTPFPNNRYTLQPMVICTTSYC